MNINFKNAKGTRRNETGFYPARADDRDVDHFYFDGMAVGNYRNAVQRAREAALHTDLKVMREAIDNFTLDRLSPPESLDDLKSAGYLREVPTDPMTQQKDWVPCTSVIPIRSDPRQHEFPNSGTQSFCWVIGSVGTSRKYPHSSNHPAIPAAIGGQA